MTSYDAVVVGSGHNALITAAYLARAGRGVLVLERNDRPGGLVRTDELTLPGFRHDTYSTAHPLLLTGPAYAELGPELELEYLNTRYPTGVSLNGEATVLSTDLDENIAEFDRLSPGDGAAFAQLLKDFEPFAGPVFGLFAADLSESTEVINGLARNAEFMHLFARTGRDLLEQRFAAPLVRGMLAPWATHLGRGVDDANSGLWVILVVLALTAAGMPIPAGGSEQLARALVALIERHGGSVQCAQEVAKIVVADGRAVGVETADGQFIGARHVVASVNPDQLYLKLLDVAPPVLRRQAAEFRYGRGCVQVHLALSEPPVFPDARLGSVGQPHLGAGLDGVSRAVNEAARGLLPAEPTISFDTPSTLDPSRCPPGAAVARLQMLEVPCVLRGDAAGEIETDGWTRDVKERFADRVIEQVGRHAPNLPGSVLARHVVAPDDLARFNPNCGPGDPYGGSHDLAQSYLFRPLPGQPGHQTAVPNVYLVGAATWPGHGVNGGSGYIVAKKLLKE